MKIDVIGAGPAGSYAAYLLAKKGHSVNVYEKNHLLGRPVQCTGILSDYFSTLMKPSNKYVENIVTKARIYSPNGNFVDARIKKNYVICRVKFANYLAELAESKGTQYYLGHSFSSLEEKKDKIKSRMSAKGSQIYSEADSLIGADGPLSPVAKAAGLFGSRSFVIGTQVEARMENDNVVEFYPYIGCYAWIVPKDEETVRIGVASYKNAKGLFTKFAREKLGRYYEKKIIENQSGVIPVFNPRVKAQKRNIFLNGDAATFVKATSGGGINQSLKGAAILAECIDTGKSYEREWRKNMYRNLHLHLTIHKIMQRFRERDWNNLIDAFSDEKMKELLFRESRDKISSMLAKVVMKKPQLLNYIRYFPIEEVRNLR